ncbi:MAG: hypothetical protein Q7R49_03495 [Candidatus Daviesbacteria bacterium]|nr:hypothetical protein [Candidatus Daviesbacteria bacterium]
MVTLWFGVAYLTLVVSLFILIFSSQTKQILPQQQNFRLYAALPDNSIQTFDTIVKEDARATIIANFFKDYHSPLSSFANEFITIADQYHLDYRLLPSIAMQESNGAKKIISNSFNPFGFGIYGDKVTRFTSYGEAIERVGRALRTDYLDQGLTTPETIMTKYTPPSLAKGGAWAKGVLSFMSELE